MKASLPGPRSGFDAKVVAGIQDKLDAIERSGVRILLAVESGSRAWGFPSPDSDYDCRFFYLRSPHDYLSLFPTRDVIELPLDAVFDVNGWDLAKALKLLLRGNAVGIEWLTSPFAYREVRGFRRECLALARKVVEPSAIARHYLHLGERQRRAYFADRHEIALKKVFYALRPAAALRWMRLHPGKAVVPMHFPTLVQESDLPLRVRSVIDELLAAKKATRELGTGTLPRAIADLIDAEFARAALLWPERIVPTDEHRDLVDRFFRRWLSS